MREESVQLERVARTGIPPLYLTSFVGRTHELAALTRLLRNSDVRLVTITGPGGSGKTRLALQGTAAVAEEFPDGCFFVDLAPLHSPDQVPCALACALDVPEPSDQSVFC
jgi:predicted ATPase